VSTVCKPFAAAAHVVAPAAHAAAATEPFAAAAHISSDEVFSRVVRRTARSFLTTVVPWREERRTLTWARTNSELTLNSEVRLLSAAVWL
jgi:hypothetical protein